MSQGGRVALHFALRHRDRVAGLFLQGAPLPGFLPAATGADSVPIERFRQLLQAGRIDEMKALWRTHELMRGIDSEKLLAAYQGRDLLLPPVPAPPIAEALGEIEAPALVVTGEEEIPWLQLVGDAIAYGLPNARRARLPGPHLCNITDPGPYNRSLAEFAGGIAA